MAISIWRATWSLAVILGSISLAGCVSTLAAIPSETPPPEPVTPRPATATTAPPTPIPTLRAAELPPSYLGPLPEGAGARLGQGRATKVSTSPDGRSVAVGMSSGLLVYDTATLKLLWADSTTEAVSALAWTGDNLEIAAGSLDGRVVVWRARSGLEVLDLASDDGAVSALDWSPDGAYLVSSGSGGISTVRDGETGEILHRLAYHEITDELAYTEPISDVQAALSPDGRRYATHYDFGGVGRPLQPGAMIVIWDVASGAAVYVLDAGRNQVASLAWSPDGQYLASGADYSSLMGLWDMSTGKHIDDLYVGGGNFDAYWSPDGAKIFANPSNDASVIIDPASREWLATFDNPTLDGNDFLGWSADSASISLYDRQTRVATFDAGTGQPIQPPGAGPSRYFLLSGPGLGNVDVWDVAAGAFTMTLVEGTPRIYRVAWADGEPATSGTMWQTPDGQSLMVTYYDTPDVWPGGCIESFFMPGDRDLADVSCPSDRAVSPDGSIIAIVYNTDNHDLYRGERAGAISIHDYKSGARLKVLRGHASIVTSLAFSPDGKLLASSSGDGTVILWDMTR